MASLALAFDILAKDKTGHAFSTAGKNADGLSSKLSNVGKVATVALGGAAVAGVAALTTAFVGGIKSAVSYQTLQKKTEAVIKSTGNVAKISVKGIQGLAASLENVSGVDEELIINGQNVLATFTKIRNEAGKGNDIFDQATEAALNLSVALGTDLQSANTLVGKALNDPLKGLTALGKAGIQFTQDQKDLIKTLVESGDTLGAQKVILGELETQFDGVAEAAGSGLQGDLARLKDAFDDAFRELGEAVLPTLTRVAQALADVLPGLLEKLKALARDALAALSDWWDVNGPGVILFFEDLWRILSEDLAPILATVAQILFEQLMPQLQAFGDWAIGPGSEAEVVVIALGVALTAYAVSAIAAQAATILLLGKFLLIAGFIVGLTILVNKLTERFKPQLNDALQWIVDHGGAALINFMENLVGWLEDAYEAAKLLVGILKEIPGGGVFNGGGSGTQEDPYQFMDPRNWFDNGGVVPGAFGQPRVIVAHGGETVLPTHKAGWNPVGEDQLLELRRQNTILAHIDSGIHAPTGVRTGRAIAAGMG